jgi:hypothetical protein
MGAADNTGPVQFPPLEVQMQQFENALARLFDEWHRCPPTAGEPWHGTPTAAVRSTISFLLVFIGAMAQRDAYVAALAIKDLRQVLQALETLSPPADTAGRPVRDAALTSVSLFGRDYLHPLAVEELRVFRIPEHQLHTNVMQTCFQRRSPETLHKRPIRDIRADRKLVVSMKPKLVVEPESRRTGDMREYRNPAWFAFSKIGPFV